ncbi:hypothetical protein M6B38_354185 [Iris pallida]|uniref:Uncharacterized protein n=1 Tax=Iris pallida TaxID=29817 RepID=A0AAX6GNV6_IRIPA|nr:hypothetical protein M6B38_354185 [Iris pallida]
MLDYNSGVVFISVHWVVRSCRLLFSVGSCLRICSRSCRVVFVCKMGSCPCAGYPNPVLYS